MKDRKRPKLPRGLRWHSESQYIWFVWYDANGKQHKKSTETTDPAKALLFKLRFLEEHGEKSQEAETADLSNQSLERVTQLYFDWKLANNSPETVTRERRIFKKVLDFLGQKRAVRTIRLANIREYQKKRRQEVSPTMKKPVGARTINYEMQLLRGVMQYADCWTDNLEARYQPLRQIKSRVGKTASKEQLMKIISTALSNEYWRLAMWCGAVAAGSGCRSRSIRLPVMPKACHQLIDDAAYYMDGSPLPGLGISHWRDDPIVAWFDEFCRDQFESGTSAPAPIILCFRPSDTEFFTKIIRALPRMARTVAALSEWVRFAEELENASRYTDWDEPGFSTEAGDTDL